MEHNKRFVLKNVIGLLALLVVCLILPSKAHATTKSKTIIAGEKAVKVGKYYFQYTLGDSQSVLKAAKTKGGLKKSSAILTSFKPSSGVSSEFMTNGNKVFYVITKGKKHTIYQMEVKNKSKSIFVTVKATDPPELIGCANNQIQYTVRTTKGTTLYSVSSGGKKKQVVLKNTDTYYKSNVSKTSPYIVFRKKQGKKMAYHVYDKQKGKITKTGMFDTSNCVSYAGFVFIPAVVTQKNIALFIDDTSNIDVYRMSLKGSGDFKKITSLASSKAWGENMDNDYVEITYGGQNGKDGLYRYDADKNQLTKIQN